MTLAFDVEERRWLVLAGGGDVSGECVVFKQCVCDNLRKIGAGRRAFCQAYVSMDGWMEAEGGRDDDMRARAETHHR
jgi:hypothetical protein